MAKRLIPVAVVLLVALTACDTETTLEETPEAAPGNECPEPRHTSPGQSESGPWGTVEGSNQGVSWEVNAGYTIVICVRFQGQPRNITVEGPDQGSETGNGFSHWSLVSSSGGTPTTTQPTTTSEATTTTTTTATAPPETTTTTTAGEVPTSTLTPGELTTTTIEGGTTTTDVGDVTTTEAGASTTTDPGVTTTVAESTTTVEVGGGTLQPGQVTTTTGDTDTTGDPGEETTTTDADVSDESEETLPNTGTGGMTTGGLAGMLVAAGVLLLLLTRKRSGAE